MGVVPACPLPGSGQTYEGAIGACCSTSHTTTAEMKPLAQGSSWLSGQPSASVSQET